jgi:hypothetical protein
MAQQSTLFNFFKVTKEKRTPPPEPIDNDLNKVASKKSRKIETKIDNKKGDTSTKSKDIKIKKKNEEYASIVHQKVVADVPQDVSSFKEPACDVVSRVKLFHLYLCLFRFISLSFHCLMLFHLHCYFILINE